MKMTIFWPAVAGATLLAACGQQESADNDAVRDAMEPAPANVAVSIKTDNLAEANTLNAIEEMTPEANAPAEDRAPPPAAKSRAEGARPAPPERPAAQPAPKQEPAPAPESTCTPEHEAMGHCKQ